MCNKQISILLALVILWSVAAACAASTPPTPSPTITVSTATAPPVPTVAPTAIPTTATVTGPAAYFALSVEDIDASAKWYTDMLGMKVVMELPKSNGASVTILEGDHFIVELIQHDDAVALSELNPPIQERVLVHGLTKAGVVVDDFNALVATLRERNVPIAFGPFPKSADQRANLIIADNEGNLIQFFGN